MTKITLKTSKPLAARQKVENVIAISIKFEDLWTISRSSLSTFKFTLDYVSDGCMKTGTHTSAPFKDNGVKIKHIHKKKSSALFVTYFLKRRGLLQFVVISPK